MEHNNDYIATEMLAEIKQSSKRWFRVAIVLAVAWLITIGAFLWYLNQYDFSSTSTYEATGYNALIDSSGNVIASDIPDDVIEEIMTNGNSPSSENNQ